MWFDSHCHLTDERFGGDLDAVLARAREAGVAGAVSVASDAADAGRVATLTRGRSDLWGTAGIHPHEAGSASEGDLGRVRELLSSDERMVAVGETGLDYHYDHSPRDVQRTWFRRQLELARDLDLPVVVHSREADEDTAAALRETAGEVRGVLHCFTGGPGLLETALELDWYVSFSGIATFRSFGGAEALRAVPPERLLVETDAPYLAPVPRRGKRNEPAFVPLVGEAVARLLGTDAGALAKTTTANARRFYALVTPEGDPEPT